MDDYPCTDASQNCDERCIFSVSSGGTGYGLAAETSIRMRTLAAFRARCKGPIRTELKSYKTCRPRVKAFVTCEKDQEEISPMLSSRPGRLAAQATMSLAAESQRGRRSAGTACTASRIARWHISSKLISPPPPLSPFHCVQGRGNVARLLRKEEVELISRRILPGESFAAAVSFLSILHAK